MLDALNEIPDALEAQPEGFHARFAVALSAEKAAQHGDLADHLAEGGYRLRDRLLRQDVSAFPLFVGEQRVCFEFRMRSPQAHQPGQSPHDHDVDSQGDLNPGNVTELQGFDTTPVFEHIEEGLDLPSAAKPIDQFNDRFEGLGLPVRQEPPRDRLDPFRGIDLLQTPGMLDVGLSAKRVASLISRCRNPPSPSYAPKNSSLAHVAIVVPSPVWWYVCKK